ncbi:MAG: TetR/AcrR family transcriptional regulator [Pseudonocardiaceae bacterium]
MCGPGHRHVACEPLGRCTIAAALGTSHRILIYHFGSKENLLIEVVRTMEQRRCEVSPNMSSPRCISAGYRSALAVTM